MILVNVRVLYTPANSKSTAVLGTRTAKLAVSQGYACHCNGYVFIHE